MKGVWKRLHENRGSIIIESTVVIPVIILLFISVIYLMMDFYTLAIEESIADSKVFEQGFDESEKIRKAAAIGDLFNE